MLERQAGVAEYLNLNKNLLDVVAKKEEDLPSYFRKIKIAFLSNFTLQGLPETFKVQALAHNLWVDFYLAPYNQYAQEILNPESELNKFQPKLVYFLVDLTDADQDQINKLVDVLRNKGFAVKLVWGSVIKEKFGDYWYTKYKELGDLRLAPNAFPSFVAEGLMGEAIAISGATKKCLVLDLDNTLWQGIVGEDGPENIKPYRGLQEQLLQFYRQGVILALNSRNSEADAWSVIQYHPDMLVRKEHIAAWRINWQDKVTNTQELAGELNLGLDSFVFVDDDPFQQNIVRSALPMVTVLSPGAIKKYPGFATLNFTEEDTNRGQMYVHERSRQELKVTLASVDDFLRQLNLEVAIKTASPETITRISQLTQKTNQFNLATRRYSELELKNMIAGGWKVWTIQAEDKFGDYQ